MLARFFSIGSKSAGSSFRMLSRLWNVRVIWEISFADKVRCDKNLKPFAIMLSSIGFSRISLAIDSKSNNPSKVRFDSKVLDLFSERFA